jgi:signal peptidase II
VETATTERPLAGTLTPWLTGLVVLVADQITKALIVQAANNQPETTIKVFTPFLAFVYVRNTGVAFSLFNQQRVLSLLIPVVIAGVVVTFMRYLPRNVLLLRISMGMILGGALSNLIDRLRQGYVVDFIEAHIGQHIWPLFNVADSSIVVGVALLAWYLVFRAEA